MWNWVSLVVDQIHSEIINYNLPANILKAFLPSSILATCPAHPQSSRFNHPGYIRNYEIPHCAAFLLQLNTIQYYKSRSLGLVEQSISLQNFLVRLFRCQYYVGSHFITAFDWCYFGKLSSWIHFISTSLLWLFSTSFLNNFHELSLLPLSRLFPVSL